MKKSFRKISIFLLAFVGITAFPSGIALIIEPSGASLRMDTSLLKHSPFENFIIPGAVLLCVIGAGSLVILSILLTRRRPAPELDLLAGSVLTGWILFEMVFIQQLHIFQFLYLTIAIVLLFLGSQKSSVSLRKGKEYFDE